MKLLGISQLLDVSMEQVNEAMDILADNAEQFLRAGGALSLSDWAELSAQERAAFQIAGNRLRAEFAARIGMAAQSEMHAAQAMMEVDGGRLKRRVVLTRSLDKLAAQLNSNGVGK